MSKVALGVIIYAAILIFYIDDGNRNQSEIERIYETAMDNGDAPYKFLSSFLDLFQQSKSSNPAVVSYDAAQDQIIDLGYTTNSYYSFNPASAE